MSYNLWQYFILLELPRAVICIQWGKNVSAIPNNIVLEQISIKDVLKIVVEEF